MLANVRLVVDKGTFFISASLANEYIANNQSLPVQESDLAEFGFECRVVRELIVPTDFFRSEFMPPAKRSCRRRVVVERKKEDVEMVEASAESVSIQPVSLTSTFPATTSSIKPTASDKSAIPSLLSLAQPSKAAPISLTSLASLPANQPRPVSSLMQAPSATTMTPLSQLNSLASSKPAVPLSLASLGKLPITAATPRPVASLIQATVNTRLSTQQAPLNEPSISKPIVPLSSLAPKSSSTVSLSASQQLNETRLSPFGSYFASIGIKRQTPIPPFQDTKPSLEFAFQTPSPDDLVLQAQSKTKLAGIIIFFLERLTV